MKFIIAVMAILPIAAQQVPVGSRSEEKRPAAPGIGEVKPVPGWPPSGPLPRTPDGKPDLSGAWEPNAFHQNLNNALSVVQGPFQPSAEKLFHQRPGTF